MHMAVNVDFLSLVAKGRSAEFPARIDPRPEVMFVSAAVYKTYESAGSD